MAAVEQPRTDDSAAPQYRRPQGGSPVLHPLGEPLTTGKRLRHEEASPWPASRRADLSEYEADSQAGSLTCAYEKSAGNWGTVRDWGFVTRNSDCCTVTKAIPRRERQS